MNGGGASPEGEGVATSLPKGGCDDGAGTVVGCDGCDDGGCPVVGCDGCDDGGCPVVDCDGCDDGGCPGVDCDGCDDGDCPVVGCDGCDEGEGLFGGQDTSIRDDEAPQCAVHLKKRVEPGEALNSLLVNDCVWPEFLKPMTGCPIVALLQLLEATSWILCVPCQVTLTVAPWHATTCWYP
jgi:hypothetical protein